MQDRSVEISSPRLVMSMVGALLLSATCALAQNYAQALATAVDRHQNGARDAALELEIVDELGALSKTNETAWLPDFWAAYILTQVTMSNAEEREQRLSAAQAHLDRARERSVNDSTTPIADLHALQSLIHTFSMIRIQDKKEEWEALKIIHDREIETAFSLDPESPVVMVFAGTDLIRSGNSEKDWAKVMGGVALLNQAEAQFLAFKQPRGLTTHYNSEWITPWRDWAYRLYIGGFDAE